MATDTARERVIAELVKRYAGAINPYRNIANAAFDAGYAEGLEDAAKVAELGLVGIALNNEPTIGHIRAVAAAIRKRKDGQ